VTPRPAATGPRVAVLADDLIWATRLADIVRRAGGEPVRLTSSALLRAALSTLEGCVVDLTARSYDGLACVMTAAAAHVPTVVVGQHDDIDGRRAARDAGAAKVFAYRALFEHGDRDLGGWVAALRGGEDGQ
jgi:FixJ family two-component response regulator